MRKNLHHSLTYALLTASMFFEGCTCKMVAQPANPNLDPALTERTAAPDTAQADPLLGEIWAAKKIGLDAVWADPALQGSKRVIVAVVSSGIDYNHEDLRNNVLVNDREAAAAATGTFFSLDGKDNDGNGFVDDWVGYDFVDGDGLPYDKNGAGTAAAGIIGAVAGNGKGIRGVAGQVNLLPIRYIDENGQTNFSLLAKALDYAAKASVDIVYLHLAQLGFGSEYASYAAQIDAWEKSLLDKGMKVLEARGTPVIVSAGNFGSDVDLVGDVVQVLRSYPNTLFVTETDQADKRPFIANYGLESVAIAAPGEGIMTTLPGGNTYGRADGTFAAAAYVAGSVALAISQNYGETNWARMAQKLITEGGDPVASLEFETTGGSRLNVAKFLASLER